MTIYLTGGSGKLGREVLKLLPEAISIVRAPSGLKNEKVVNFANINELKSALLDCNILIHLAGSMKFQNDNAMHNGNIVLTQNLLAAIPLNAKVIYSSSIAVYGKNLFGVTNEETPVNPDSVYAQTKFEAEKLIMMRKNSIALRIGPIYGPDYEDYPKFIKLIKKGKMVIFGNGKNMVSFVHVADVAKAIKNAIAAEPGIYIISGVSETQEKIYEMIAKELGVKPSKTKIPIRIALLFAYLLEKISLLTKKKPFITREHVNILGKNRVFNFSKAEKELKFKPRNLEEGVKEAVRILDIASNVQV